MAKILQQYQQWRLPHGIGGVERVHQKMKKEYPSLSRHDVATALKKSSVYTLYKPVRNKFKRDKIFVSEIDQQWQFDLMDMTEFAAMNDGVKFLLTGVDVFSRQAYVHPLKSKEGKRVVAGLEPLLRKRRRIEKIQTDQGKEFLNSNMKSLMSKYYIHHFTTLDATVKCAIVERFNRTLRDKIMRYIQLAGFRYVDALPSIVDAYNNTPHTAHGLPPNNVTHDNCLAVYNILYPEGYKFPTFPPKYAPGTEVRIAIRKNRLEHGATQRWTNETFMITNAIPKFGVYMYKLQDSNAEKFDASFYEQELQPVITDRKFLWDVENVLATKKIKKKQYMKVRWKGLPSSFDKWVKK